MMIEQLERNAVKWIAKLSPWLAPIPSAYKIYESCIEHLGFPVWVAVVAAVVIETLGLSTMYTRLWMSNWNGSKLQSDEIAPVRLANVLVASYFVITITLIVVLNVFPALAVAALAILPGLAAIGTMNLVLIAQQEQREQTKADDKAEKARIKVERARIKAELEREIATAQQVIASPEQPVAHWTCWCGWQAANGSVQSRGGHVTKHINQLENAESIDQARGILTELYSSADIPDDEQLEHMLSKRKVIA